MKKTKIICTMGPNTENEDTLREMIIAGMDVARFNSARHTRRTADQVQSPEEGKRRAEYSGPFVSSIAATGIFSSSLTFFRRFELGQLFFRVCRARS